MMKNIMAAEELAARLSRLGFGEFEVSGDRVIRRGPGEDLVLVAVGAGRGRPYEVDQALARTVGLDHAVMVATEFTPGALEKLTETATNYMDRRRTHVWLNDPAFVVHVQEEETPLRHQIEAAGVRLSGSAGGVVIALLSAPQAKHGVTELAERSGVSAATAQRVVFELESDGFLVAEGTGPRKSRRILDPSALLDRYAEDAARDRRRALRCRVIGENGQQIAREIGVRLREASIDHALSGVAAAMVEAPALTGVSLAEFWVAKVRSPEHLRQIVGGIPSNEGANVVLWLAGTGGPLAGAEYDNTMGLEVASRFRVYADLLANPRRGREQAAAYREKVIGF